MANDFFAGVRYYVSATLPESRRDELATVLDAYGATDVEYTDAALTHYITRDPAAKVILAQISSSSYIQVTPWWVERSAMLGKQQPPQYFSPDPAQLFSGVTVTTTDLSPSDNEVICAAVMALGGQFRDALVRDVTHVLALTPGSAKYETAMELKDDIGLKVLVPHWFDDVVRLGYASLPTEEYEWPAPRVFRPVMDGESTASEHPYKLSSEKRRFYESALNDKAGENALRAPRRNVWSGLRVLLSVSLELSPSQRDAHEEDIRREGGTIVTLDTIEEGTVTEIAEEELRKVDDTDVFITKYRAGRAFVRAYKTQKTIGTLTWLWYVRSTGALSRPTDRLLHYPIPRTVPDGFAKHLITISNYTGKDREYLKKLITTMGAEFTPNMSIDNTVVIASRIGGSKTDKAAHWGIATVNHLWIEDCFAAWRALSPAQERYIAFPPGVDFAAALADRALGEVRFDDAELRAMEVAPAPAPPMQKRPLEKSASAQEVEDVVMADIVDTTAVDIEADLVTDNARMSVDGSTHPLPRPLKRRARGQNAPVESEQETAAPPRKKLVRRAGRPSLSDAGLTTEGENEGRTAPPVSKRSPVKQYRSSLRRRLEEEQEEQEVQEAIKIGPPRGKPKGLKSTAPAREEDEEEPRAGPSKPKVRASPTKSARRIVDSDEEESVPSKKIIPIELSDDDDIDLPTRITSPTKPRHQSRSTVPESAQPSSSAPTKSPSKSKLTAAVVVPTVESVYGSPSKHGSPAKKPIARTRSQRAVAAEGSADTSIPATAKRGRPPAPANATAKARPPPSDNKAESPAPEAGPSRGGTSSSGPANGSVLQRTPSKRSAARNATRVLQETIMPDVLKYQKEAKTGKFSSPAGYRVDAKDERAADKKSKRASLPAQEQEPSDDEAKARKKKRQSLPAEKENEPQSSKKRRRVSGAGLDEAEPMEVEVEEPPKPKGKKRASDEPEREPVWSRYNPKTVRILTTQVDVTDDVRNSLLKIGVKFVAKPVECTHLVSSHIIRTEKFLSAISVAQYIVTPLWITDSARARKLLFEDPYTLKDGEAETKYGFTLEEAVSRAKIRKLFDGMTFYVTKGVAVDPNLLKNVVVANGGTTSSQTPTVRILTAKENRYVVSAPTDKSIWQPLAEQGYPIYTQELILTGALKQKIDWSDTNLRVTGSYAG